MHRRKLFLGIGIFSSVLFVCVATLVSMGWLLPADQAVLRAINSHATPHLDSLFLTVTNLGSAIFVTIVTLLLLASSLVKKRYKLVTFITIVMGGMIICNLLLKALFERPRPDLWEWLIQETSYSFPSGHATASMALGIVLLVYFWHTKWRIFVCVMASLCVLTVSFSRLYLGVHYPSDIIGGWLLSLSIASFTAVGIDRFTQARRTRRDS